MKKIILIVEDTPDLLDNLTDGLTMANYEVWAASNVHEAFNYLSTAVPDLIITDLMMSEIDGFEFARRIKSDPKFKAIPVIAFSAKPIHEYEREGKAVGIDEFIQKPGKWDNVYDTLPKFLQP